MNKTIINFQNYKDSKEKELLDNLDLNNNTYVWSRCEHCGELVISKLDGYSNELECNRCHNTLTTYLREATKEEITRYMIRHKLNYI